MTKPPLALVPGLGCTAKLYDPQLTQLSASGQIIMVDHACGDSMSAIAGRFLERAPERFALAGLSMGGYVAFEIMRLAPQRVARLALLDTNALADSDERKAVRQLLAARVERGEMMAVAAELFPGYVHPSRVEDHHLRQIYIDMMAATGAAAFIRQLGAIAARTSALSMLPAIAVPTLVLVGAEDAATPVAQAREIASGIPGARLEIIADCGHLSTLEKPEIVTRHLAAWWR